MTTVEKLAPNQSAGHCCEITRVVDDRRATRRKNRLAGKHTSTHTRYIPFSTQLKGDWTEMLGCGRHNNPANSTVAGVEDMVKLLLEQLGRLGNSAIDDLVELVIKILWNVLGDDVCCGGCDL